MTLVLTFPIREALLKRQSFSKNERIVSRKQVDELFGGEGSHSRSAYPVRAVYVMGSRTEGCPAVQVLISVPKKRLHHAVDRNRVKRQLREAYRQNKQLLTDNVPEGSAVFLAFIWLSEKHLPSAAITQRVKDLLVGIAQALLV